MKEIGEILMNQLGILNRNTSLPSEKKVNKWNEFCEIVKNQTSRSSYENWIACCIYFEADGECFIEYPNAFVQDYLLTHFKTQLTFVFGQRENGDPKVKLILRDHRNKNPRNAYDEIAFKEEEAREQQRQKERQERDKKRTQERLDRIFKEIPAIFKDVTIDSCKKIHGEALMFPIQGWFEYPKQSIFLLGLHGRGKSSLAVAILKQFMTMNPYAQTNILESAATIANNLRRGALENAGDVKMLDSLKNFDIITIDDFGRESSSDYVKRQFFDLIDHRHAHQLPTIITSNLTFSELEKKYDPGIISRFQQWLFIEFKGKDLRQGGFNT